MTRTELDASRRPLPGAQKQWHMNAAELQQNQKQLVDAHQRAADADQKAKVAQASLAKLAALNEEQRGLLFTLSGSVRFSSHRSTLLPEAHNRLDQVADARGATKERSVTIEGHTASRGSESHNLDLSQRRAEAVRACLVQRGYEPEIEAKGIGKASPVSNNGSAEGRSNNRRVDIIVQPKTQ